MRTFPVVIHNPRGERTSMLRFANCVWCMHVLVPSKASTLGSPYANSRSDTGDR